MVYQAKIYWSNILSLQVRSFFYTMRIFSFTKPYTMRYFDIDGNEIDVQDPEFCIDADGNHNIAVRKDGTNDIVPDCYWPWCNSNSSG